MEVLAASQSPSSTKWFQGTADAVRQYLWLFENAMRDGVEDFLILSGVLLRDNAAACSARACVSDNNAWLCSAIAEQPFQACSKP